MITRRRWSDTVLAEYREDGNPFGGYLVRVLEAVDTQANEPEFAPVFGYDGEAPGGSATATKRPAGLDPDDVDRSPGMSMPNPADTRPCMYCIASVEGFLARANVTTNSTIKATAEDCALTHRDDPRVYALARALAKVMQDRHPSAEQISWFLEDADEVIDDFDADTAKWSVRRLPLSKNDEFDEIEVRLRINGVTYVALEGGKDTRGSVVRLSEFRSWGR